MTFSFLVTVREGIEMALIVAILLGYLRTVGQKQHFRDIWFGVAVAAAICLAIGASLEIASAELDKRVDLYCAITRLINKEAIWFWTFQNTYYAITKAKVKGIPKLYSGIIDVSDAWLE